MSSTQRTALVPVYDRSGNVIGHVGRTVTSIGASKTAGHPVEWTMRFGKAGWVIK